VRIAGRSDDQDRRRQPEPAVARFVAGQRLGDSFVSDGTCAAIRFGIARIDDPQSCAAPDHWLDWLAQRLPPLFDRRALPWSRPQPTRRHSPAVAGPMAAGRRSVRLGVGTRGEQLVQDRRQVPLGGGEAGIAGGLGLGPV